MTTAPNIETAPAATPEPAPAIGEDLIAAYERDGAVCLRGAFSADWLAQLAGGVERALAEPGPLAKIYTADGAPGRFFGDLAMWQRIPAFEDFVRSSPAAAIAGEFMRARTVTYYHDQLLVKEPGTLDPTPWHHDQPYYFVDGAQVIGIWLPLDPVPRRTCLEFVAGSHRWGRWFAPRWFRDGSLYDEGTPFEPTPDIEAGRGGHEILGWEMAPGDCIVFHALALHGAPGNPSPTHRRRAYATRWLGDDARFAARPGRVSPPIEGHGLVPGDPLHKSAMFPLIWRRACAATGQAARA